MSPETNSGIFVESDCGNNCLLIKTPVAGLYRSPSFRTELITQAVMWEQVEILETSGDWYRVRQEDNYRGWLHKFYAHEGAKPANGSRVVINERHGKIHTQPDKNAQILAEAVFGTELPETDKARGWHHVRLPGALTGWLEPQQMPGQFTREALIHTAETLIGVPYLWGGRTAFGFDCSGFVQTVFKHWGLDLPRDSGDQFAMTSLESIEPDCSAPGDLVFFSRKTSIVHVGVATGKGSLIHCQGAVRIDPLFSTNNVLPELLQDTRAVVKSIEKLVQTRQGLSSEGSSDLGSEVKS